MNKLSYYIIENNVREDIWQYVRAFDSLKDARKFKKDHMRIIKVTVVEEEVE